MDRFGHPVQHLDLVAGVRDALPAGVGDGVGERAEVVRGERRPHRAVVVVQEPDAPLVVRVGLVLVLEHRHRPALGSGHDRLRVPVRALHQPDADRLGATGRPGDELREVVARVLQVGLDHDAGVDVRELGLVEQLAEELEREVLDLVVLHVEVDERVALGREPQQRSQPPLRLREAVLARERAVQRCEGGGLDADVHARDASAVVELEDVVRRPRAGAVEQRPEQLVDPRRIAVGLLLRDRLLAEEVDGERAPLPPQPVQPFDRRRRTLADDELLGHLEDVPPGDRRRDRVTERHLLREVDAESHEAGSVCSLEVLVDVAEDVGGAGRGREDVDEAEQLRLEVRVGHRPREHALAPPAHVEDAALLSRPELGDPHGQLGHLGVER